MMFAQSKETFGLIHYDHHLPQKWKVENYFSEIEKHLKITADMSNLSCSRYARNERSACRQCGKKEMVKNEMENR